MLKECTVRGESLPHGDIDVVAGQVDNGGEVNWRFGVQLIAEDEVFQLHSPIAISAKSLATSPPSKSFCLTIVRVNVHTTTNFCSIDTQVVFETLAFSEVLENKDKDAKRPIVFFAGMCINRKS